MHLEKDMAHVRRSAFISSLTRDFNGAANLSLTGNFVNSRKFYALSTGESTQIATIAAANITNTRGALITTVVPSGGYSGFSSAITDLSLSLQAVSSIRNA